MLFLALYETPIEKLDAAIAKRLEWDVAQPETMKVLGEWVQHGGGATVRGALVFETEDPGDVQALVLFYGTAVSFDVRAASDVASALARATEQGALPERRGSRET